MEVHGNYKDYYSKRTSSSRDPRLALLPPELLRGARVLDVGCNQGRVTCEAAQIHGARRAVGVDIDSFLISQAWKHRRHLWSMQGPREVQPVALEAPANGKRKRPRPPESMSPSNSVTLDLSCVDYFPAALEHMFGPLLIPPVVSTPGEDAKGDEFPLNVSFRAADWAKDGTPEDSDGWDVVLALSVSKWIHLSSKDDGLRGFFQRAFDVLRPGGAFILEPQEWSSYSKAWRMNPILKENAKELTLRPDEFGAILHDIGFMSARHLGSTGHGGFRRPVDLYIKPRS